MIPDTVKFRIGQKVYSVLDADKVGIITAILYRPSDILYCVAGPDGADIYRHEFEITEEKPITAGI